MPGLDYFSTPENGVSISTAPVQLNHEDSTPSPMESSAPGVYYNPRLDPKNYLEGPLSPNPATRLRQMLARPGIVVRDSLCILVRNSDCFRWHPASAMASAQGAHSKQDLTACIKGLSLIFSSTVLADNEISGAATTASRLGQPDLAIATMNDFVQVIVYNSTQCILHLLHTTL